MPEASCEESLVVRTEAGVAVGGADDSKSRDQGWHARRALATPTIDATQHVSYTRAVAGRPMETTLRGTADPSQKALRRKSLREDALNLPNLLTMGRIVAIPVVLWLQLQDTRVGNFCAMMVYSAAAVTDFVDGWLARRMGLTSLLGKFLDPLADKLIVLATLM